MNRLGLKISCLAVAVIIWIQVASTSVVEQDISLPLRVTGLQTGLTIIGSELPREIPVRVKGSKLRLLRHNYFNNYVGEVRINLAGRNPGPAFFYDVDAADIFTDLDEASVFPPAHLHVHIDWERSMKLPVALDVRGGLPEGRAFLAAPAVVPDSILVVGPQRFFDPLPSLITEPLDLGRISASDERDLALVEPPGFLSLDPAQVRVRLEVGLLEERTLANLPVIALVDAGQPEVGVSPPVADIMVRGVADSVRTLTRDRLLVTVPVGSRPIGVYNLSGQVDIPPWLTLLGIDPPEFKVIVGDPPLQNPDPVANADSEGSGE